MIFSFIGELPWGVIFLHSLVGWIDNLYVVCLLCFVHGTIERNRGIQASDGNRDLSELH